MLGGETTLSGGDYNSKEASAKYNNKKFEALMKGKLQKIYDLIEEGCNYTKKENKNTKTIPKSDKNEILDLVIDSPEKSSRSPRLFEGRNIIKKVKTNCLRIYEEILQSCGTLKEKVPSKDRFKIFAKKKNYKIFKSDISKYRNKILLDKKMETIFKYFSNINLSDREGVHKNKIALYDFMLNSSWEDILYYIKRKSATIFNLNKLQISSKEVKEYMEYIKNSGSCYKERINLDKQYLKSYEPLVSKESPPCQTATFNEEVFEFITKFECK